MAGIYRRRRVGRLWLLVAGSAVAMLAVGRAADSPTDKSAKKELREFKPPQAVQTTKLESLADAGLAHAGYVGISTTLSSDGKLAVETVAPDSPASKAGIQPGDVVVKADGAAVSSPDDLRKLIRSKSPGKSLTFALRRKGKDLELATEAVALGDVGRKSPEQRAILGVRVGEPRSGDGARVEEFTQDSPAEKAGLKVGDTLIKVDDVALTAATKLADVLSAKKPGETVSLAVRRADKQLELKAKLAADTAAADFATGRGTGRFGSRGRRLPTLLKPDTLQIAIVGIEFPDVKHNDKITPKDWENEFFSRKLYTSTSATGQQVYGSVNDFYIEQSSGAMHVEGKMLGWVLVAKNRMDYSPLPAPPGGDKKPDEKKPDEKKPDDKKPEPDKSKPGAQNKKPVYLEANQKQAGGGKIENLAAGKPVEDKPGTPKSSDKPQADKPNADKPNTDKPGDPPMGRFRGNNREALLREALDKLVERDGKDVLSGYDAVIFVYAGKRAVRTIESVYWPHMSMMNYQTRRLRHYVVEEGGERQTNISVLCHEMGHIFGLPDLYIRRQQNGSPNPPRPQNPYAESLWQWDLMAVQVNNGRPQHMSAWSKEQLGWIKPAVIDPQVRQKIVLSPIENSPNECIKIPVRPDGSEYFLLENRRKTGFDTSVPAEGLLIWRVVFGRPVLEAAHGLSGSAGLRSDIRNVPFPTDTNDSFTPYSKPSSAALTGDELPVYITKIRRLDDGRITFNVGYGFD